MIHLDTNILIDLASKQSTLLSSVTDMIEKGEHFACSSVVWFEFCCGPYDANYRDVALSLIENTIIHFDEKMSEIAASLFNATGRRRASRADCMIAAVAISGNTPLVTCNEKDFDRFSPHGLTVIPLS